jgi:hypothetical protein
MMESADHRKLNDLPVVGWLYGSRFRGVLLQGQMRAGTVIIGEVASKKLTQVILIHDDHMVEAVPA